jgi:hypothetical protein
MLFVMSWVTRATVAEDGTKRIFKMLSQWKPPAGFEFKGFYDYSDGTGGVAIVDASSAEAMLEVCAAWGVHLEFTVRPIVPVEVATPIFERAITWRDSVR